MRRRVVLAERVVMVGRQGVVGAVQRTQGGLDGLQVLSAEGRERGQAVADAQKRGGVV